MHRRSPWLQILALALVGLFAVVDRQILVLLIEPVKRDLGISDTEVSLLVGGAFALFYSVLGLPLSRLADRWSRRGVIMAGVAVWGLMTCACAFAGGFWQLFAARMGVGLGEAAFSPSAYALTAQSTPRHRWGLALGMLMLSASVGYGLALIGGAGILRWSQGAGGVVLPGLGAVAGWKAVFLICGGLTLLTLPLLAVVRGPEAEPARRQDGPDAEAWRLAWRERGAFAALFVAVPPASLAAYGLLGWLPSYLIRVQALTPVQVGVALGLIAVVFGGAGILLAALAMDRIGRRRDDAPVVVLIAAIALTVAGALLLPLQPSRDGAFALAALLSFAIGASTPAPPVALQAITPDRVRAQVSAAYLLLSGALGFGAGPTAVALLTDQVFRDEGALGASMAVVGSLGGAASILLLLLFRPAFRLLAERLQAAQNSEG